MRFKTMIIAVTAFVVVTGWMKGCGDLKNEAKESTYVVDGSIISLKMQELDYALACFNEYESGMDDENDTSVTLADISKLGKIGLEVCVVDGYVGIPRKVSSVLAEAVYVPNRAAVAYAMVKSVLEGEGDTKPKRCSDIISPLIMMCPQLLKPHTKNISRDQ